MKRKLLKARIVVETINETAQRWEKALKGKAKSRRGEEIITVSSWETLASVLAPSRLHILAAIAHLKPESIAKLTRAMKKDFKNVHTDVRFLADLGLIDLREQAFAFLLFEFERSGNLRRKSRIESDLAKIRNSQSKTEGHIQVDSPLAARAQVAEWYYLNPINQLVHIFLTIQKFAISPEKIASRLDISPAELTSILSRLESEGIILLEEARYKVSRQRMHLPAENSIFPAYRQLIRVKALSRMNSVEQNGDYTFSSFFSASESCRDHIKLEYLKFLRIAKDLADGATKNAVFQMNFDLLKWS